MSTLASPFYNDGFSHIIYHDVVQGTYCGRYPIINTVTFWGGQVGYQPPFPQRHLSYDPEGAELDLWKFLNWQQTQYSSHCTF